MMNANAKELIKNVWGVVKAIAVDTTDKVAIAGGAVADAYFGKEVKDIDIFVCEELAIVAQAWSEVHGFEPCDNNKFTTVQPVHDWYTGVSWTLRPNPRIRRVYKGTLFDVPVDIVVVRGDSVKKHVFTEFDLSVKAALYDGVFRYSTAFRNTIKTGIIKPVRVDITSYIRGMAAAKKYGLKLDPAYEMFKDFTYAVWKEGVLEIVFGKKNAERFEEIREDNYEPNPDNVLVADVFHTHYLVKEEDTKKLKKQFYYLHQVLQKKQVVEHPLLSEELEIQIPNRSWVRFREIVELCRGIIEINMDLTMSAKQIEELKSYYFVQDTLPLCQITEEDFIKGTVRVGKREERIGKYLMKLIKKYNALLDEFPAVREKLMEAKKEVFDTRVTKTTTKVFFAATPYVLTHISTNTEWKTSCQRWKLLECTEQNYGLLGNLGGATMVAYAADERSDYDSSKWKARMLIRIGTKGDLFIEIPYTTRSEYSELHKLLAEALKEKGITAYHVGQKLEAKDFKSLPIKHFAPYNNSFSTVQVKQNRNTYYFEGYGVEQ